jgi:hypothetical protein
MTVQISANRAVECDFSELTPSYASILGVAASIFAVVALCVLLPFYAITRKTETEAESL